MTMYLSPKGPFLSLPLAQSSSLYRVRMPGGSLPVIFGRRDMSLDDVSAFTHRQIMVPCCVAGYQSSLN